MEARISHHIFWLEKCEFARITKSIGEISLEMESFQLKYEAGMDSRLIPSYQMLLSKSNSYIYCYVVYYKVKVGGVEFQTNSWPLSLPLLSFRRQECQTFPKLK